MKRRLKIGRVIFAILILIAIIVATIILLSKDKEIEKELMPKLNTIDEVNAITDKYDLGLDISYEYNDEIEKDKVISQSINENTEINIGDKIIIPNKDIVISKKRLKKRSYKPFFCFSVLAFSPLLSITHLPSIVSIT